MKEQFGDIVVEKRLGGKSTPPDGLDLLVAVAARYGATPEILVKELKGKGVLAAVGRDLLGLQMLAPSAKSRAGDARNWQFFVRIENSRRNGRTLEAASAEYLDFYKERGRSPPVGGTSEDSVIRHYRRLKKQWVEGDVPESALAALFANPPPKRKGDKKKA